MAITRLAAGRGKGIGTNLLRGLGAGGYGGGAIPVRRHSGTEVRDQKVSHPIWCKWPRGTILWTDKNPESQPASALAGRHREVYPAEEDGHE